MIEPTWLLTARKYDGLTEVAGSGSNPEILRMARAIGAPVWYHDDDQPWCAVFMNAVLQECGLPMAVGSRGDYFDRLRALTFVNYGQGLARPALGAIAVFARPEGAHVAMYLGERGDRIKVYGGNQRNQVCSTWMERSRLRGYRWPVKVPLPAIGPIWLDADGQPLSVNEA